MNLIYQPGGYILTWRQRINQEATFNLEEISTWRYQPGDINLDTIFNYQRSYVFILKQILYVINFMPSGLILTALFYVSNIIYPLKNKIEM